MSINRTCAISSLRSRLVSVLIYGFADSKHESGLPLSPKFPRNNRKQKKSTPRNTGRRPVFRPVEWASPAASIPHDARPQACVAIEDPCLCKLALCAKEKAGRFLKGRIIPTQAGIICCLSNRRRHDKVSGSCPDGGGTIPPC